MKLAKEILEKTLEEKGIEVTIHDLKIDALEITKMRSNQTLQKNKGYHRK